MSPHPDAEAELDRLLNDPATPMEADRVWSLLAELAARERWGAALPVPREHYPA
ncbi:MAG: hypothetical protein ACP5NP_02740 [Acetobacteraceae bacterium]|jgi:hypothetical protein